LASFHRSRSNPIQTISHFFNQSVFSYVANKLFTLSQLIYAPIILGMAYNATEFMKTYPGHNYLAGIVHVGSWIVQFIGHGVFEKRSPALKDNIAQGNK